MSCHTLTTFLYLIAFATIAAALDNITSIPLVPETCQGFPGYVPRPIGSLTQQFFFEADGTSNVTMNGLRSSLHSSNPSMSELIINTDPTAVYNIFSCSGNGSIADIHGGPSLVFSGDGQDRVLGTAGTGFSPEVYLHEIESVVQDGVFLGWGNVTTWGFEHIAGQRSGNEMVGDYYRMRLLDSGSVLKGGELAGFVRIYAL